MGPGGDRTDDVVPRLVTYLETLASAPRLELLRKLRQPLHVGEIRVSAGDTDHGDPRPISRQAVTRHLDRLVEVGLVRRLPPGGDGRQGHRYVLARDRIFALFDELRDLTRLRPLADEGLAPFATQAASAADAVRLPDPPRLLVAYGPDDRLVHALSGEGPWVVGRSPDAAVLVDHDPYASAEHAKLVHDDDKWVVEDMGSRNGTWVNWNPVRRGAAFPIMAGDLLVVGRTQFVFQA